jgi:two-component system response regulator VicR
VGKTVLVVDDEKNIVDILTFNLQREGYDVLCAYDGRDGLEAALSGRPDLILLDVMLPYMNGFDVCAAIRKQDRLTPIIMLTAREEENDKIFGLELGADDYIVKPFSIKELLARIKTNIRRMNSIDDLPPADSENGLIPIGGITVDTEKLRVLKNGKTLDLTQREYDLVKYMALSAGKVFTREELMTGVWNYDYFGDIRLVDVAVRRLREKIEDDPANPALIITKRGAGYYLNIET